MEPTQSEQMATSSNTTMSVGGGGGGGAQKRRRPASQLEGARPYVPDGDPYREYRAKQSRQLIVNLMVFLLILGIVSLIAVIVLWQLDMFSSGKWETKNSNVIFVKSLQHLNNVLTDSSLPHIIAIYSESCPSCKRMRAPFLSVAKSFSHRKNVRFVAVKADNREFMVLFIKWDVNVVPTILYLPSTSTATPVFYQGGSSVETITDFVNSHLSQK